MADASQIPEMAHGHSFVWILELKNQDMSQTQQTTEWNSWVS